MFKVGQKARYIGDGHTFIDWFPNVTITYIRGNEIYFKDQSGNPYVGISTELEPLTKSWDTLEKGDILVDSDGDKRQVLAVLEDIVFFSAYDGFDITGGYETKQTLQDEGNTIEDTPPEDNTVELTLSEVAKKFKIDITKLRIKDE